MLKRLDDYVYVGIPTSNFFTKRKRTITIQNNESFALEDYQVCIEINDLDLVEKASPRHLILMFDGQKLPYWVEEWKRPNGKAKIWVKLPELPANGEVDLELFYNGYCDFGLLNGDDVFVFFDDFDEDSLNTSKWTVKTYNGSYEIKNSKIYFYDDQDDDAWPKIYTDYLYPSEDVILECKCQAIKVPDVYMSGVYLLYRYPSEDVYAAAGRFNALHRLYSQYNWSSSGEIECNNYQTKLRIIHLNNNQYCYGFDDEEWKLISHFTNTITQSNRKIELTMHARTGVNHCWFDWVLLRKHTANEPTVTIGEEQTVFMRW